MAYSETRIVIGGLAHVPILIFIANFIKGKFGIKTGLEKDTFVKEEPVKIIEVKGKVVKEAKAKAIKEISNKLDSICLLYTSPSPRDRTRSRMPSSA